MKRILLILLTVASSSLVFITASGNSFAQTMIGRPVVMQVQGGTVTGTATSPVKPNPSISPTQCIPRPACLDARPRCMIAEPANGWCKTPTPFPTPMHCGGFIKNAPTCPAGYTCKLGRIPDAGGFCQPAVSPIPSKPTVTATLTPAAPLQQHSPVAVFFTGIVAWFKGLFHF